MRNLKRVLALVIAFSMMLSVVAFANYADVDADADYAGAVELLSALDIFQGDENGNFNPDNTITRAEMAAIIIRAKGLESAANASKGATMFPDVAADHWASGYVNLASQNGIIMGTDEGLFDPNGTLTYEAAVAMIVRALGFEPVAQKKGGWTAGYVVVANSYKVTEGAAANATRANLAILMANALETPMMDQTSYGSDEKYEVLDGKGGRDYRTLLTDMDIYVATGIPGEKDVDEIVFDVTEDSDCGTFVAKKDDTEEETFTIGESDIALYQNQQVDAYVLKDGRDYIVKAVVASDIGETFELLSDDIAEVGEAKDGVIEVEYYVDAANSNKTKTIKVKSTATIEYNKGAAEKTLKDFGGEKGEKDVELVFIENTGDSTFDYVVATAYISDRIDYVDAERDRITLKTIGRTVEFDFEDEEATIILVDDQGNELTVADFAEDDVVAVVADNAANPARYEKYIKVVKLSNAAVTGTVDETFTSNGEEYIVINGEEYVSAYGDTLEAGDEGTFYIGLTGKIIDFDGSLAGANYAYILEGAIADGAFTGDQWQIKLLTEEDGIVTYDIKKDYHDEVVAYLAANAADFDLTPVYYAEDDLETEEVDETTIAYDVVEDSFLWDGASNPGAVSRLVEYAVNSKGEIKELVAAVGTTKSFDVANDEYNEGTQAINGASLEDDVVIFNVSFDDVKDVKAADISFLVDEAKYTGFALKDEDAEYSVMVVSALESRFSVEEGFAIVTKVSTGKDAEGEEVVKVSYVQNEEEGVITFGDDSKNKGAAHTLDIGDVFMFVADADGLVSEYIVIAEVDGDVLKFVGDEATIEKALTTGKDATDLVLGYIENDKRVAKAKGEIITVAGTEYVVPGAAYKYTFNTLGRNDTIEISDFMYDADYYEVEYDKDGNATGNEYACPVLIRLVEEEVVDVYTSNVRVAVKEAPKAE